MTSGTCRAATRLIHKQSGAIQGLGGRNPPIPDPTSGSMTARPYDNAQGGPPYVWVKQHATGAAPDENVEGSEYSCWVQAINPAEVQSPGRVFYLADSRDYRPFPGGWPRAGWNSGWGAGYANMILTSARHFGYGNVLYLDGHVSRDGQMHQPQWNMGYDGQQAPSTQWRVATFDANMGIAHIATQMRTMPVLMVKGWEYFFDASGVKAQ
jgi:prepilin-type processing-associated H-X9-DG protein